VAQFFDSLYSIFDMLLISYYLLT